MEKGLEGSFDSASILSQKDDKADHVGYFELLKYASTFEKLLFAIGVLTSAVVGLSGPISFVFFSDVVNDFINPGLKEFQVVIERMAILGGATFVVAYIQMFCLQLCARRQAKRIRYLYFTSVLRQEPAWFDQQNVGTIITRLTEGVDKIEVGLGEKAGIFVQYILIFVGGIVIGYTKNWELSLVATAVFPPVVVAFAALGMITRKFTVKERMAYSKANAIAGEVLSSVKTVFAFEGQRRELNRYAAELSAAEKLGLKRSTLFGFVVGASDSSIYILMAVTFWYGIKMLSNGQSNPGDIILVVMAMLFGGATIGQAFHHFDYFGIAVGAASEIFPVIDRVPPIDKFAGGQRLEKVRGEISFEEVSFTYPTRQDIKVLNKFTWTIKPGQNVAIVGPSGSGKSTVVQMIQRFYDTDEGNVFIDGVDIRDLDLSWWRSQIGVVSQEPVLFAGTIAENIRLGRQNATQEEIEAAAKVARAHDFISKLPEAYETFVAEGGGGMSGGQKQRIAIARALIRDPRILLLDEATSALDTKSEKSVQRALDAAKQGRTTVIVAHRLSTIRDADVIIVVDRGSIVETGTHEELMAKKGIYAKLALRGLREETEKGDESDEDEDDDDVVKILETAHKEHGKGDTSMLEGDVDAKTVISSLAESVIDFGVEKKRNVFVDVLRMNKPEKWYMVLGCLTSVLMGVLQASFVIVYTEMYDIFLESDEAKRFSRTSILCGVFGVLAFLRLLFYTLNGFAFGVSGERLTKRCRTMLFETMLKQEVGWYDEAENQPGALTGRLAADVPMLQNVSGRRLGSIIEMLVLSIASLFIGFFFSWQIALVSLAYFPILAFAGAFEAQSWTGEVSRKSVKGASLAHEAFSAVKTVFSLQIEDYFAKRYSDQALLSDRQIVKGVARYGLVSAIANSLMSFEFAGVFYAGGKLMEQGQVTLLEVFRSYSAVSFAASNLGYTASFAPDAKKASKAAEAIFQVLNRQPELLPDEGEFPDINLHPLQGSISFRNVRFRYPTRRRIPVLKGFSYDVPLGKSVALVGQSGCGKSTIIQLVQRFYEPSKHANSGIILDGMDMSLIAPNWIRRQIGVVSQEPNLLDMTIRDNIAYGLNHVSGEVPMEAIIDAAKQANAHNFIIGLPQQYDTPVGPRGSQLSGGQKQRVAIARALVRNPRLLLLDEATAALDNESEQIVQAALDEAMKKGDRTTLVVAHRLTTVENCDLVVVLEGGRAVESGSPAALMEAKGAYFALHNTA
uniref:P-loop containing nucleoside triphosphate hydrolase protein n=2 Tax=Mesocestoides corti TaxID=53468 RepID=A0A5K3EZY6_MESCO